MKKNGSKVWTFFLIAKKAFRAKVTIVFIFKKKFNVFIKKKIKKKKLPF